LLGAFLREFEIETGYLVMSTFIVAIHVIVCIALILIVLLQTGKGADMGAVFGGGSSQTLFGSAGASTFLTKMTTCAAVIFMLTSLSLAYFSGKRPTSSIMPASSPVPVSEGSQEQPSKEADNAAAVGSKAEETAAAPESGDTVQTDVSSQGAGMPESSVPVDPSPPSGVDSSEADAGPDEAG
jgi:preprotein translocase subunit SecG